MIRLAACRIRTSSRRRSLNLATPSRLHGSLPCSPVRIADIVDRLNATYLDWIFSAAVVADVALQLQANWMTDYRNSSGIVVDDGEYGPIIEIEDSSRVDPWIVRQAEREVIACRERLDAFSRLDRAAGEG